VILGSLVPEFHGNALLGNGDELIVEACEYKANMLNIQPQTIVLTNIEEDHLDFYKDLDDIIHHFQQFINSLPIQQGCLVMNADDQASKKLAITKGYQVVTFGLSDQADFRVTDVKMEKHRQVFMVWRGSEKLGQIALRLPGHYNVMNALAAIAVSVTHGISWEVITKSLGSFKGIWRRFERVGRMSSSRALVVSDYAHHPTAVKETLLAAKQFYPRSRLVVVFQPHHIDRTIKLFDDFVTSLTPAPVLIVNEIYQVAGREEESLVEMSSQKLVDEIKKHSAQDKQIFYAADLEVTYNEIEKIAKPKDVILIMGAGDIDKVARKSVNQNTNL
jgi:UDP-N-acetylmuramate--alanine ligase